MYEAKLVAWEGLLESNRTLFGIDVDGFSSLSKLWHLTALVSRFIKRL